MKRLALTVAFVAAAVTAVAQPGWTAQKSRARRADLARCTRPSEAEQAIRYMTDLMVASSACGNTTYREFALRNRETIIRYQKTMIARMRGKEAFDRWNTSLANEAALRQSSMPLAQFCKQKVPLLAQAKALDADGFRAAVLAQAAKAPLPAGCTDRAQR